MKLGAMLVRDGRLTEAQIERAVSQQARSGGRFGTVLYEMGFLDADTLTVYLGLELGIPIATRAALDRAKRAAVRLLSPELAERFLCVPLVVQDRQLIAAMRDPHDLLALDELNSATGYRVIPRVAPEVRLHYYLERYYGVPRPDRYKKLGDEVAKAHRGGADTLEPPAPPLPGLPPQSKRPNMPPPNPAPPIRTITPAAPADDEAYDDLAVEMEADADEVASLVPVGATPAGVTMGKTATAPAGPAAATPRHAVDASSPVASETLEIDDAVKRMTSAGSRVEVADTLIAYSRGLFDIAALLVVREGLAFGWRGFGPDLDLDRIETICLPLESSSMFHEASESLELFAGAAPPSAIHAHLFKLLRTHAPRQAVVVPVVIRERVVNLLYGQRSGEHVVGEVELDGLRHVTRAAAAAYARLIAVQKQTG